MFQPRDSEKPSEPAPWYIITNTPENCLWNLEYAYNYRQNAVNYHRILSEQFEFYFDTQDVNDFTVPFMWQRLPEIAMLLDAHQSALDYQGIQLTLNPIPNQNDVHGANSVTFYRDYDLWIDSLQRRYQGKFQLLIERESDGLWRIKRWYDFRENSEWTWGRMKNEFS